MQKNSPRKTSQKSDGKHPSVTGIFFLSSSVAIHFIEVNHTALITVGTIIYIFCADQICKAHLFWEVIEYFGEPRKILTILAVCCGSDYISHNPIKQTSSELKFVLWGVLMGCALAKKLQLCSFYFACHNLVWKVEKLCLLRAFRPICLTKNSISEILFEERCFIHHLDVTREWSRNARCVFCENLFVPFLSRCEHHFESHRLSYHCLVIPKLVTLICSQRISKIE